ncbi:MAG TPA: FkbM family methyltransferase [Bryobacteraceae bacterium]|nr:FkbM family methyltransferase [Bryobacteraceae bacterium]
MALTLIRWEGFSTYFGPVLRKMVAGLPPTARDHLFMVLSQYATPVGKQRLGTSSIEGGLALAKENGFEPAHIVDVGAFAGEWGRLARRVFPNVPLLMIEGNGENEAALQCAAAELGDASYQIALLGAEQRPAVLFYRNGKGTSVLKELTAYQTIPERADMHTLDTLAADLAGPLLLKLDVQGYELEVLRGGQETLQRPELVLLEVSLLPYNEGAPLFADVVRFMSEAGYALFDICDQARRESDDALFQADILFAKADSKLRAKKPFWRAEHADSILQTVPSKNSQ